MIPRLLRLGVLLAIVAGGFAFYRSTVRPDTRRLAAWAQQALRDIFGEDVRHGRVTVDLLQGVRVADLSVQPPGAPEPLLFAQEVEVRHDPLALAAGSLRLLKVVLVGPRIAARETDAGEISLEFPFRPPTPGALGRLPSLPALEVRGGEFRLTASGASGTLAPGARVVLGDLNLTAVPEARGTALVAGSVVPQGLGQGPGTTITFTGRANPDAGTLDLYAVWERLRLTRQVRAILSPKLLEQITAQRLEEGPHRLAVRVERDPAVEAGRFRVQPEFRGTVRIDVGGLPGAETIEASTREQLNELLGRIDLSVEVREGRVALRDLTTSLAGAKVYAAGRIEDGGRVVDIDLSIEGLRLDDPGLRRLLGDGIAAEFLAKGTANAVVTLRRDADGEFRWEAAVELLDATLAYLGSADPAGEKTARGNPVMDGFPYAAQHCVGQVYLRPGELEVDGIEGRHGAARIRVRGSRERSRTGGPTGFVRWGGGEAELVLTVEATDLPVDADLAEAVEGSDIHGFLDTYRVSGVLDRVVIDVVRRAGRDGPAVAEVEVESSRLGLVYTGFPLPFEARKARVEWLRPERPTGPRARVMRARGEGRAGDGEVTVAADLAYTDRRGRVRVEAQGVRIEGPLVEATLASEPGQGGLGDALRFLRPRGRADVTADLPALDDPAPATYEVRLRGAAVTLGDPASPDRSLTVDSLVGAVRAGAGRVEVRGVEGRSGTSPVRVEGTIEGGTAGRWDLRAEAKDLRLSRGLLHVVATSSEEGRLLPQGLDVRPGGRADLAVRLRRDPAAAKPLTAAVEVRRGDFEARVGDLPLRLRGGFSVDGDDLRTDGLVVEGQGVSVSIPRGRIGAQGIEGTVSARLVDVRLAPEVLALLPESLRGTVAALTQDRLLHADGLTAEVDAQGAMTIRGALGLTAPAKAPRGGAPRGLVEFAPLAVSAPGPDGARRARGRLLLHGLEADAGTRFEEVEGALEIEEVRLGDPVEGRGVLRLDTARVAGLRLRAVTVPVTLSQGFLSSIPFTGTVYEGRFEGQVRAWVRDPVSFEGRIRVEGLSVGRMRSDLGFTPEIRGSAGLEAEFQSRGPSARDLTAAGRAWVRDGDLGALPPVATIPSLLASALPSGDPPRFERAQVEFALRDETIEARRIVLSGPLFDMEGRGTLDFDGRLDLVFAPQFVKTMLLPGALQVPVIGDVLGLFREDPVYVVRAHGTLGSPRVDLVPFPFLSGWRDEPSFLALPFAPHGTRRVPRLFH